MANLIYSGITSLDGYIADADGNFEWGMPSDEVHSFVNELERPIGTYLYGRRMYEVMSYWETAGPDAPAHDDYAQIWRATDKIVYSKTLETVSSARTRIEREFDPADVRALKASAQRDISVGGAGLGGQALAAGLVDEVHLYVAPVVVGGGTQFFPDGVRLQLELVDERRFDNGMVYLHYRVNA